MVSRARAGLLFLVLPLLLGSVCEGEGTGSEPVIDQAAVDPRCTPLAGPYPSGLTLLPGAGARAAVMQFAPPALLSFDLDTTPPRLLSPAAIPALPPDSDGDGVDDAAAYRAAGLCPIFNPDCRVRPIAGALSAPFPDLVLAATSGYEQLLFLAPESGELAALLVENPPSSASHRAADYPLLPPEGQSALRTALSTKLCIRPPPAHALDSSGQPIGAEARCDPSRASFLTRFTADAVLAADRLFVASSNVASSSRSLFNPGTLLVFELDRTSAPPLLRPDAERNVVFTTDFNPTGVTRYVNGSGREFVLVTLTGALSTGGERLSAGSVEVVDAVERRVLARIPLGLLAGPSFGPLAIDPSGRVALLGAEGEHVLYAIDLAPLDDPALLQARAEPVLLDGSQPGFPDARIFDADAPLRLPRRTDGPSDALCPTRTQVALNRAGDLAFVTDWCDGTLAVVSIDLTAAGSPPLARSRFRFERLLPILAPKDPLQFGLLSAPSMPRVRAGRPGIDFTGPDVFFLANEPEGQLCAIRVEL